jgi:hypothetical protein
LTTAARDRALGAIWNRPVLKLKAMPLPAGVASLTISQMPSWKAAESMPLEKPAAGSAGPNWFQNWVSRLARSTPMALLVPPKGLAFTAEVKSVKVWFMPP